MGIRDLWHTWDDELGTEWTENKLIGRKWGLVFSVVYVAIGADLFGHELGSNTTQIITILVPAFVTIQGFVDMLKYRVVHKRHKKPKRKGGDE